MGSFMREFSDFEKAIINRAIELSEKEGSLNVLNNILEYQIGKNYLPDYCYIKITSKDNVTLQINKSVIHNGIDLRILETDIKGKLLTIVMLFEYLAEKRLMFFVGDTKLLNLGSKTVNEEYTTADFYKEHKEIKELIHKYSSKEIFVSETLRVLAKNDFKSKEQLKNEEEKRSRNKQLRFTQFALILSLLGLIASLLVPIIVTSNTRIVETEVSGIINYKINK